MLNITDIQGHFKLISRSRNILKNYGSKTSLDIHKCYSAPGKY